MTIASSEPRRHMTKQEYAALWRCPAYAACHGAIRTLSIRRTKQARAHRVLQRRIAQYQATPAAVDPIQLWAA